MASTGLVTRSGLFQQQEARIIYAASIKTFIRQQWSEVAKGMCAELQRVHSSRDLRMQIVANLKSPPPKK